MATSQNNPAQNNDNTSQADTGNASNPTPHHQPAGDRQLLNEKAEKYLRESGNIEDMPDPQEEQDAEDKMKEQKTSKE